MNNCPPSPSPDDAVLTELAALGLRAARVLVRVMEAEQAGVVTAEECLPKPGFETPDITAATSAGMGMDMANSALVVAVPRLEGLMRALDRASRSVRRSLALRRRLEAGWPRAGSGMRSSDDKQAMMRRQVARGVGEVIAQQGDSEAAERLFDDLAERLDDPVMESELLALPVETVVRRICAELGLAAAEMKSIGVERTTVLSRGSGQSPELPDVDTC